MRTRVITETIELTPEEEATNTSPGTRQPANLLDPLKILNNIVIFPLRLICFLISCVVLSAYLLLFDSTKLKECCELTLKIAGIQKQSNLKIKDKNSIIIFNHINLFDAWIMYSLFDKPPAIVARKEFTTGIFWEYFTNFLKIIPVSRKGKEGTVKKIDNFLDSSKENLLFAPDGCGYIKDNENIAPFRNSIFVNNKRKIIPVVIRFSTDNTDTYLNWDDLTIWDLFFSILKDGNVKVYIERLDDFYKEKDETTEDYKERIRKAMSLKLKAMPFQYPTICKNVNININTNVNVDEKKSNKSKN